MTSEIELKYLLLSHDDSGEVAEMSHHISTLLTKNNFVFEQGEKYLSNRYFDTPELSLRNLDIGLRVREKNRQGEDACFEQTIKTAGKVVSGLHQRPEFNVKIDNASPQLSLFPTKIWPNSTAPWHLQKKLIGLFDTRFKRTTWLLSIEGSRVEIALDQGDISCAGFEKKYSINELELELVNGDRQVLFTLAKILMQEVKMRPGLASKAKRGYDLAEKCHLHQPLRTTTTQVIEHNPVVVTRAEFELEIIPMRGQTSIACAFCRGIQFTLTQLQKSVDHYIQSPSLTYLSKINELITLLRQGFWLFKSGLTPEQVKLRDELSYFMKVTHWINTAVQIQELTKKSGSYRKNISRSDELIQKLNLEKRLYPSDEEMIHLFHSERFNQLQLSLLQLLLDQRALSEQNWPQEQTLCDFAQQQLSLSLQHLTEGVSALHSVRQDSKSAYYLALYPLLIRSLLTGSWFASLFNSTAGDAKLDEQLLSYRRPWLDVKHGISELQALALLQKQLLTLQGDKDKLLIWLTAKIDNLLVAIEHSSGNALSIKPYWLQ